MWIASFNIALSCRAGVWDFGYAVQAWAFGLMGVLGCVGQAVYGYCGCFGFGDLYSEIVVWFDGWVECM